MCVTNLCAGLPDGLFSCQKLQFGYILEDPGIDNVGIECIHWEHFTAIWYIYGNLV
jgi:hypothetical protein